MTGRRGLSWPSANPLGHSIAFDRAPIVLPHLAAAWVILAAYWLAGQAGGSAMKLGCVLLPTTMASIRYRSGLDSPIPCPCWCSKRAGHGTRPSYAGSWTSARARCVPERWGCTGERGALMASILSDTNAHWHLLFLVGLRARGRSEPSVLLVSFVSFVSLVSALPVVHAACGLCSFPSPEPGPSPKPQSIPDAPSWP